MSLTIKYVSRVYCEFRFGVHMCYIKQISQPQVMGKQQQAVVQQQKPRFTPIPAEEARASRLELLFRKICLAAITMLGIGYTLVSAPSAILIANSLSTIPLASQPNIDAIAGRILFLMASSVSIVLGVLLIFGGVQFYERGKVKGVAFLGISLGSFQLLCLGTGSTLLAGTNAATLALTCAPIIVTAAAALYTSSDPRCRLLGSATGVLGGAVLAYAILNLRLLYLIFGWDVPFTGPFLSLTVLESVAVVLAPAVAAGHAILSYVREERAISHVFTLLIAMVYGLGAFVGSIVLSMSFWNWIWKSPWIGPFYGAPDWFMNIIVFWSASLVLMDIAGILLVAAACVGFICVARGLS